jgi:hypothetical protein
MKHIKFLFLLALSITTELEAQEFNFGLKGGVNRSSVIGDFRDGYNGRISFHAGVFAEIPLKGKFSFHPELVYSSQGFTYSTESLNFDFADPVFRTNTRAWTARDFLTIPLVTRLNFTEKFSLEFGPQVGFLVRNYGEIFGERGSSSGNFRFDVGPIVGMGFDLNKFKIQARYFIGLSDLLRKSIFEERGISSNQFDSVFQLSIGYTIL